MVISSPLLSNALVEYKGRFFREVAKCFYGTMKQKSQKKRFYLLHRFYVQVRGLQTFRIMSQTLETRSVWLLWGGEWECLGKVLKQVVLAGHGAPTAPVIYQRPFFVPDKNYQATFQSVGLVVRCFVQSIV